MNIHNLPPHVFQGFRRANQYIASQGPTTSTLADFWRMVWELDCPTIVMVTKLEEEDKVCGERDYHFLRLPVIESVDYVVFPTLHTSLQKKCEQYWPSYGSTTYGNVQVTLKEAENLAEYSIRTFSVSPVSTLCIITMDTRQVSVTVCVQLAEQSSVQMPVREVKQFHFLKWPDHGVPTYATALLCFRKRVQNYHPDKRGPMVVHCRSDSYIWNVMM